MKPAVRRGALAVAAAGVALLAWLVLAPSGDELTLHREFAVFGGHASLTVQMPAAYTRDATEQVLNSAQGLLLQLDHMLAAHGDGELGQLNQALARGEAIEIPEAMKPMVQMSARAWFNSAGAFDARAGHLLQLWGLADGMPRPAHPPQENDVNLLAAALKIAPPLKTGKYGPAQVQLDFGGIAKGHAADLTLAYLERNGVHDAILDLGGTVKASGHHGPHPWKIGIGNPRTESGQTLLATLELEPDEAVATRGDYEHYFEYAGQRFHSIIDPRDGSPARGIQSVTVVGGNAAWMQATSTAVFVAGTGQWRAMSRAMGVQKLLVVNAEGALFVTKELAPRLHLADGIHATTVP